ncbi:pseudouridine synthase [Nonomuraea sp. CA-218870]|uniref:pseudouridine synthase n=1 Tax=Nonomuraea sp. CA-218870 TaxID=3239998 RepID=UPI003D8B7464
MINRRSTPSGDGRGRGRAGGSGRGGRPAFRSDDSRGRTRRDDFRDGSRRDDRGGSQRDDFRRDDRRASGGDGFRADRRGSRDDRGGFRRDSGRGPSGERGSFRDSGRGPSGERGSYRGDDARGGARRDDRGGFRRDERGGPRRDDRWGSRDGGSRREDARGGSRRDDRYGREERGGDRRDSRDSVRADRGGSRAPYGRDGGFQRRDGGFDRGPRDGGRFERAGSDRAPREDRRFSGGDEYEYESFGGGPREERGGFRANRNGRREGSEGPVRARYGRREDGPAGQYGDRSGGSRDEGRSYRGDDHRGGDRPVRRDDYRGGDRPARGGDFRGGDRPSRGDFRGEGRGAARRDEGARGGRVSRRDGVRTIGDSRRDAGDRAKPKDRFKTARQPVRDRDFFPEGYTDERDTTEVPGGVRLQKVLAQAGVASRRACEEMIGDGRVTVDGQVVRRFGAKVDPAKQVIHVDGKRIPTAPDLVYYALNKPIGVVSTMEDPQGRPCLADYVEELAPRLFHVGRLDTETEGLLLLTNDGELANRLTHPSYGVPKKYWAKVPGPIPRDLGRRLKQGIELEDGIAKADDFQVVQEHAQQALVEVVLHEGRKHVVRRMLEESGHRVIDLARIEFGPVKLGRTKPGTLRALTLREIGELYAAVKL